MTTFLLPDAMSEHQHQNNSDKMDALARVSQAANALEFMREVRVAAWLAAKEAGASQYEIAKAARVSRTTVGDQLWIRS